MSRWGVDWRNMGITNWLFFATEGLHVEVAKEVTSAIRKKYELAYKAACDAGLPDEKGRHIAILSLGAPWKVRQAVGAPLDRQEGDLEHWIAAATKNLCEDAGGRVMNECDSELTAWLETATKGLCEDAVERAAGEVTSHYADAVQEAREKGMSEAESSSLALESLGSPKKANRAFKRTYLTQAGNRQLEALLRPVSKSWWGAVVVPRWCRLFSG